MWRVRRGRALLASVLVAALLVAAFEVGVRIVAPDAVEYRTVMIQPFGDPNVFTHAGTITDRVAIGRLRSALTAQPASMRLWDIAMAHAQGTDECSVGTTYSGTYRFTWHGLPVEVVSQASVCGSLYEVSSGGWTDPTTYFVAYPAPLAPAGGATTGRR